MGEGATPVDVLWDSPVQVTAGAIVNANSGTPSTGVLDYVIYWSPVTSDGNVADE